jgi:hypothetical protein
MSPEFRAGSREVCWLKSFLGEPLGKRKLAVGDKNGARS